MWYRYHRPRRWRGGFFFPFPFLFFILVMNWGHLSPVIMTVILPVIILLAFGAFMRRRFANGYQQPYSPYQNNQAPNDSQNMYSNQYYQPQQPATPYMPYQQGYQAEPPREKTDEKYQEGGSNYPYPRQEQYQEYEQPQAQYPEQMPPMQ